MLSYRRQLLLLELMEATAYVTVSELAERFSLSQRMIRHELLQLDDWLRKHQLSLLRDRKSGVRLIVNEEERKRLADALQQKPDYIANEERIKLMAKTILRQGKVHMDQLADEYGISRNTLLADLRELRRWFAGKQLEMTRRKGWLQAEGSEFAKRSAYLDLLRAEVPDEKLLHLMFDAESARLGKHAWNPWFDPEDAHVLFELIHRLEKKLNVELSDAGYSALLLHLLMAIERLKHCHAIAMEHNEDDELTQTPEYAAVAELVPEHVRRHFGVELPAEELSYIAYHLLGAQRAFEETREDNRYMRLARTLVGRVEKELNRPLLQSERIVKGLAVHLKPALYRAKFGIRHENPLLPQLEAEYGELLEKIRVITNELTAAEGVRMESGEIGYIAMHICSGLPQPIARSVIRVAVVCSSGLGTASLLVRRLSDTFPQVQIVGKYAFKQLPEINDPAVTDFILSTVAITLPTAVPWMQVSPLLNEEDIEKLRSWFGEAVPSAEEGEYVRQANDMLQLVAKYATIHDSEGLIHSLFAYFKGTGRQPSTGRSLSELLSPDAILLQIASADWREAIRTGIQPLMATQACGIHYEDKLIEILNQPNHHMIIAPGVAFPHASPEDGVWKTSMSLLVLKESIPFGAREEQVWLVILLAATDKHSHVPAISQLLSLLNDERFLNRLRNAVNPQDIWELIRAKERVQ